MENIEKIIEDKKNFIESIFNYYSQHSDVLIDLIESIVENIDIKMEEEKKLWIKWQKKIIQLSSFNKEIKNLINNQKTNLLDQKRIIEISYLKSSFEKQENEAKKHYEIYINKLNENKKEWEMQLALYLMRIINNNTEHKNNKKLLDENLIILKQYCNNWKAEIIKTISNLLSDIKKIEEFLNLLLIDIESAKSTELVDMLSKDEHINVLSSMKNSVVSNKLQELSIMLNDFNKSYDLKNISNKLNINFSEVKESLSDYLSDSSMGGVRASIRIIKKMEITEQKVLNLLERFEYVENLILPHYQQLIEKKHKMLKLCNNAQKIEQETTIKWINDNLNYVFQEINEKIIILKKINYKN